MYNSQDMEQPKCPLRPIGWEDVVHACGWGTTLPFATTQVNLGSIMLTEISQTEKTNTVRLYSHVEPKNQNK